VSNEEILEEICTELDRVRERLDDLAFDLLREAVRTKADRRPELEKRVTRARRALERAIATLRSSAFSAKDESD
jgi:hypothetical protein